MAQPQVMAVVTEAIATVEKATEHHGKQNTQPFNRVFICDPHLLHPRNKKIYSNNRKSKAEKTTTNLSF